MRGARRPVPGPTRTGLSQPGTEQRALRTLPRPLKPGHALSYAGLFLFTVVLYFRPFELFPSLKEYAITAHDLALMTLLVFIPSQLDLEGTLTARPREVTLALLLGLAALLSMPLALSRSEAWDTFNDTFVKALLMFVVIVNAARNERRLKGLLFLALAVSCVLSISAINDYRLGRFAVEGYRVEGLIHGMFDNPNDMALQLVITMPVAVAMLLNAPDRGMKTIYAACAVLMVLGTVVTFSRGGFLGLVAAGVVLAIRLGRRHRTAVLVLILLSATALATFAPGNYANRILAIVDPSRDPVGSGASRQALLVRSVVVAFKNPLFGVGIGNFHTVSIREQVSHNAYTQVAAEMGLPALLIYVLFLVTPLQRLRRMEAETAPDSGAPATGRSRAVGRSGGWTFRTGKDRTHLNVQPPERLNAFIPRNAQPPEARFHYLAIGLQASLVGYMVCSFFASVAYLWYLYYLVGYAVCLGRIYESRRRLTRGIEYARPSLITHHSTLMTGSEAT